MLKMHRPLDGMVKLMNCAYQPARRTTQRQMEVHSRQRSNTRHLKKQPANGIGRGRQILSLQASTKMAAVETTQVRWHRNDKNWKKVNYGGDANNQYQPQTEQHHCTRNGRRCYCCSRTFCIRFSLREIAQSINEPCDIYYGLYWAQENLIDDKITHSSAIDQTEKDNKIFWLYLLHHKRL